LRVELLRRWRKGERVTAERASLDRIEKLAQSWRQQFRIAEDNSMVTDTDVGKLIMAAYPERIARQISKLGERYKMVNGRTARLPDHDPLHRDNWIAIAQVDAGSQDGKIFLAAPLDEKDLEPLAREQEIVGWDDEREMVIASREMRIGYLTLSSKPLIKIPDEKKVQVICEMVREKGLAFLNWNEDQESWQARVLSLRTWRPDEGWPDVTDQALLAHVEEWLSPFLTNIYKRSEMLKLDLNTILSSLLPWELSTKFPHLAPSRMEVPSGSNIKLIYKADASPPILEVRLQEVFGMFETPTVNEGRTKVIMHLLSPGYKPVQVTQDLKSFWSSTYQEVRKELRSRYPKHSWPEDPWTAQAVRGVRRKN
jgi:ATP-dependent helicase HrpB